MFIESSPVTTWRGEIKRPQVHSTAYIHHTAVLIGDVRIGRNVTICPGVVIRADEGSPIIINEGTNIQDGVVMHCLMDSSIEIGTNCSIAHGTVIHGPSVIGKETFVGFNSVVLNARVGDKCFIGHCALVTRVTLPDDTMVPSGKILESQDEVVNLPAVTEHQNQFNTRVVSVNDELRRGYKNINHLEIHYHEHEHRARSKRGGEGVDGKEIVTVG